MSHETDRILVQCIHVRSTFRMAKAWATRSQNLSLSTSQDLLYDARRSQEALQLLANVHLHLGKFSAALANCFCFLLSFSVRPAPWRREGEVKYEDVDRLVKWWKTVPMFCWTFYHMGGAWVELGCYRSLELSHISHAAAVPISLVSKKGNMFNGLTGLTQVRSSTAEPDTGNAKTQADACFRELPQPWMRLYSVDESKIAEGKKSVQKRGKFRKPSKMKLDFWWLRIEIHRSVRAIVSFKKLCQHRPPIAKRICDTSTPPCNSTLWFA